MASLDEIIRKIEEEKQKKLDDQKLVEQQQYEVLEKQRLFMLREREYYNNLYERASVSNSVSSASAGGHNKIIDTYTLNFNIQNVGDLVGYYIEGGSNITTVNWGDGTTEESMNTSHEYSTPGTIQVKFKPLDITYLVIWTSGPNIYNTIKKSEFERLTSLTRLDISTSLNYIEPNALDNCPLKTLWMKDQNLASLKSSAFNNIITLQDIYIINGPTITYFDSDIFRGMNNLKSLNFYNTPFESTVLVDQFLIDLNISLLSGCTINIPTHRTTYSNSAVSQLESRGCTINIDVDNVAPLILTMNIPIDQSFNATFSYTIEGIPMHVDWGDGSSDDYINDSKKKGGWAYLISHYYSTQGIYTITINIPIDNSVYFFIQGNNITNITLPPLISLETLYFNSSSVSNIDISMLTGLKYLYLNDSQYTSIPDLHNLHNLQEVNLSNCRINSLVGNNFNNLSNLTNLQLNNNLITDIPPKIFNGLSSLTSLRLNNNKITNLQANILSGLTSLSDFIADYNLITNIEVGAFNGVKNIANISLSNNQLSGLTYGIFSGLTSLWYNLDLQYNHISYLSDGIFEDLTTLRVLYLNGNILTNLSDGVFRGLNNLETLGLSNNMLTQINSNAVSGLTNLISLDIQNNTLQNLQNFTGMTHLINLFMSNSQITATGLTINTFAGLSSLSDLYLSDNSLGGIDPMVFNGVVNPSCILRLNSCGLSTTDVDNLIIRFNNTGRTNTTLDFSEQSRSHSSDLAFTNLTTIWHCNVFVTAP